jgi:hypothetical protein
MVVKYTFTTKESTRKIAGNHPFGLQVMAFVPSRFPYDIRGIAGFDDEAGETGRKRSIARYRRQEEPAWGLWFS